MYNMFYTFYGHISDWISNSNNGKGWDLINEVKIHRKILRKLTQKLQQEEQDFEVYNVF